MEKNSYRLINHRPPKGGLFILEDVMSNKNNTVEGFNKLLNLVKFDIVTSFEDISQFKDFEEFYGEVEKQNAYEEEWAEFEKEGIKSVYLVAYNELLVESKIFNITTKDIPF